MQVNLKRQVLPHHAIMELLQLVDWIGENETLAVGGLLVGMIFGVAAQQSQFCLRAAAVEFSRGNIGNRTAIWLVVFTVAVFGTQLADLAGMVPAAESRQIASPQSISGALIGGLLFGTGMVLARGCASRLLVLSATGNLRALLSGLVFAVVAQASLRGFLSPAREAVAGLATTQTIGGNSLLEALGMSSQMALLASVFAFMLAVLFSFLRKNGLKVTFFAMLAGLAIPAAWLFTAEMGRIAFEPVQLEGVTFTGPSADTLMMFLSPPGNAIDFDIGLVPGVFLGSFLAAALTGQLALQGFEGGPAMRRYLLGAALMGFGGMLAGGCAVGAGVTGASVFAITAWVTLFAIWASAMATDWLVDRRGQAPASTGQTA